VMKNLRVYGMVVGLLCSAYVGAVVDLVHEGLPLIIDPAVEERLSDEQRAVVRHIREGFHDRVSLGQELERVKLCSRLITSFVIARQDMRFPWLKTDALRGYFAHEMAFDDNFEKLVFFKVMLYSYQLRIYYGLLLRIAFDSDPINYELNEQARVVRFRNLYHLEYDVAPFVESLNRLQRSGQYAIDSIARMGFPLQPPALRNNMRPLFTKEAVRALYDAVNNHFPYYQGEEDLEWLPRVINNLENYV